MAHPLGLPAPLVQGLLGILIALVIQPFVAAATMTLYLDLKPRAQTPIVSLTADQGAATVSAR